MTEIRRRIAALFFILMVGFTLLGLRLAYLQIVRNSWYREKALSQRLRPVPVDAKRGVIYDRNYQKLAVSVSADAVYATPSEIKDPEGTAAKLAQVLDLSQEEILSRLTRKQATVWIQRKLDPQTARQVRNLRLPGIGLVERPQRYYPHGELAAHVLGIAGIDNQGLEGLEFFYDEYLRGTPGRVQAERDARGREIPDGIHQFIPPQDGYDLVLTIDHVIQYIAEREIERAVQSTGSERGAFIAMDPKTGEILAWALYPKFDPNNYQDYPATNRRNFAIADMYEPGSTFKIVTGSSALDAGVVTLNTPFFDSGELKIGELRCTVGEQGGHGAQNFVTATENSCNPVFAILGAELLGAEKFYEYITKFGFGKPTGVDFPGEAGGLVPVPGQVKFGEVARWANVGFGQGIAVTPLQLLQAAATIANDGVALRPHFVREIRDKDGNLIKSFASQEGRQVLSSDVAKAFAGVMRSVVVNGSGGQAEIEGYRVAGKTGTAQVPRTDGRGYGSERISSFVGFAPVDDPKIAGLVVLYHPKGQVYGGVIAAPVFSAVVEDALEHLGVKKRVDRPVSPKTTGTGERLSVVPNVRNYSRSEAEKLLRNAGLRSEVQGSGEIVLDQVPKPSAEVPIGTTVQLITEDWQSQVESRSLVEVPSVIGLSIRDAAGKLTRLGLRLQVTGSGAAVVQVPEAGTLVPEQATVQVKFE